MNVTSDIITVKRLAARLAGIDPADAEQQALLGFAIGAAYSLEGVSVGLLRRLERHAEVSPGSVV